MTIKTAGGDIVVTGLEYFDLEQTLRCGQCFRYHALPKGGYLCLAADKAVHAFDKGAGTLVLSGCTYEDFEGFWRGYFDLDRDYAALRRGINADPLLQEAMDACSGIRVLRQDFFETLISFIISANNNIPRIRGIVERLCARFGQPRFIGGETYYTFPRPQDLAARTLEELAPVRAGFRAKYILSAARMVLSGEINEADIRSLPLEKAREILMHIPGVGPKVAHCVLLYGAGRLTAFPADVWIRRVLRESYGGEDCDPAVFGPYAGLAQMYLFHHARITAGRAKAAPGAVMAAAR